MSPLGALMAGWLALSLGTLLFLSALVGRALEAGGLAAFRRLGLGFPALALILLLASLGWPWTWWRVRRMLRERP